MGKNEGTSNRVDNIESTAFQNKTIKIHFNLSHSIAKRAVLASTQRESPV